MSKEMNLYGDMLGSYSKIRLFDDGIPGYKGCGLMRCMVVYLGNYIPTACMDMT